MSKPIMSSSPSLPPRHPFSTSNGVLANPRSRRGASRAAGRMPGKCPLGRCPALGPRRNRQHQTIWAPRWCLPPLRRRRLPRCIRVSWPNHAACKTSCVRLADNVATAHATLGSGWLVSLGRSGFPPAGSHRRFPSCRYMAFPFTKLCRAQHKGRPRVAPTRGFSGNPVRAGP